MALAKLVLGILLIGVGVAGLVLMGLATYMTNAIGEGYDNARGNALWNIGAGALIAAGIAVLVWP